MSVWLPWDVNENVNQARWQPLGQEKALLATNLHAIAEKAGTPRRGGERGVPNPWARLFILQQLLDRHGNWPASAFTNELLSAWRAAIGLLIIGQRHGKVQIEPMAGNHNDVGVLAALKMFLSHAAPTASIDKFAILKFTPDGQQLPTVLGLVGGPTLVVPGPAVIQGGPGGLFENGSLKLNWGMLNPQDLALLKGSIRAAREENLPYTDQDLWGLADGAAIRPACTAKTEYLPDNGAPLGSVLKLIVAPGLHQQPDANGHASRDRLPFRLFDAHRGGPWQLKVATDGQVRMNAVVRIMGNEYRSNADGILEVPQAGVGADDTPDIRDQLISSLCIVEPIDVGHQTRGAGQYLSCEDKSFLYPLKQDVFTEWCFLGDSPKAIRNALLESVSLSRDGSGYRLCLRLRLPDTIANCEIWAERAYEASEVMTIDKAEWERRGFHLWPDFEADDWDEYWYGEYRIAPKAESVRLEPVSTEPPFELQLTGKIARHLRWWKASSLSAVQVLSQSGAHLGLVLVKPPENLPVAQNQVLRLGVDLGSTHTTAAFTSHREGAPQGIAFSDRVCNVVGRPLPSDLTRMSVEHVLACRLFGVTPLCRASLLNTAVWCTQQLPADARDQPFASGVQFQAPLEVVSLDEVKGVGHGFAFSLKWDDDDAARRIFLRRLWQMLRAELRADGFRLAGLAEALRIAYPGCMEPSQRRAIVEAWREATAHSRIADPIPEARAAWFGVEHDGQHHGLEVVADVGGSTTDVFVSRGDEAHGQNARSYSFRLAGGAPGWFLPLCDGFAPALTKTPSKTWRTLELRVPSEAIFSGLLRQKLAGDAQADLFNTSPFAGVVIMEGALLAFVTGLALGAAIRGAEEQDRPADVRIVFVGLGSHLLQLAGRAVAPDRHPASWLTKTMIERALGSVRVSGVTLSTEFARDPSKLEVAKGLCRMPEGDCAHPTEATFLGEWHPAMPWYSPPGGTAGNNAEGYDAIAAEFVLALTSAATKSRALKERLEAVGLGVALPPEVATMIREVLHATPVNVVRKSEAKEPRCLTVAWIQILARVLRAGSVNDANALPRLRARRFTRPVD